MSIKYKTKIHKTKKRKLPLWFIFGIILSCLFLVVAFFDFYLLCKRPDGVFISDPCGLFIIIASVPIMPFVQFSFLLPSGFPMYLGMIILATLLYFILGAILGYIVRLILNKK